MCVKKILTPLKPKGKKPGGSVQLWPSALNIPSAMTKMMTSRLTDVMMLFTTDDIWKEEMKMNLCTQERALRHWLLIAQTNLDPD